LPHHDDREGEQDGIQHADSRELEAGHFIVGAQAAELDVRTMHGPAAASRVGGMTRMMADSQSGWVVRKNMAAVA
jgi:hypothetical protein